MIKDLLIICHSYRNFQKDPTEIVAHNFSSVTALVRTNYFAELGRFFPLQQLKRFSSIYKIDKTGLPRNVQIFQTPVKYFPTNKGYENIGQKHLDSVNKLIRDRNIAFDLVHAHFTWSSGYVGAKLKEQYNIPFIVTAHGYDIYDLPFRDAAWREKIEYVLNTADSIITVSNSNREYISKLDVDTAVHVIPNGFKGDLFYARNKSECRRALGLPLDQTILLTVGNLESVKGHRYLIDAVGAICKDRNDVICVIVGMGKEIQTLWNQVRSAGLEKKVLLAGGKNHVEIPLWINACDLFILPSLNEGNPTVMFEALGCGKPFIGTKVGGVPEVITSSEYGLLVEPANVDDLADKLLQGLEKGWDKERILDYAEQFTWEKISNEIVKLYMAFD